MCVCVCVRACMRVCVSVRVCVHVCVSVSMSVSVSVRVHMCVDRHVCLCVLSFHGSHSRVSYEICMPQMHTYSVTVP